jgi:hypothetical protein
MAGLMSSTMPSAIAWHARSALDQWVICSPSAMGSRQASSTIWARCRGGNLLGTPLARIVQQEFLQPTVLVAAADAPDGGPVALQAGCDIADALAGGHGQDDPSMLHLEPSQVATVGNGLKDGGIRCLEGQRERFSTTHGRASEKGLSSAYPISRICCRTL